MTGMISHHAQAVVMSKWAASYGASGSVKTLARLIEATQSDEIQIMQGWLEERNEAVPAPNRMQPASHSEHSMPGMLTPAQMAELESKRGAAFDKLFLQYMIQHHEGALTMAKELFGSPGAAQDMAVFEFANGVVAHQTTEINRMKRMLAALPSETP
jgi:uncharacterized protein (DUF305 family)